MVNKQYQVTFKQYIQVNIKQYCLHGFSLLTQSETEQSFQGWQGRTTVALAGCATILTTSGVFWVPGIPLGLPPAYLVNKLPLLFTDQYEESQAKPDPPPLVADHYGSLHMLHACRSLSQCCPYEHSLATVGTRKKEKKVYALASANTLRSACRARYIGYISFSMKRLF